MNRDEEALYQNLSNTIQNYEATHYLLPGISIPAARDCFIRQLIDSIKRVTYLERIQERGDAVICIDPNNPAFDPLKASVYHKRNGNLDEAFWLVFLSVHFGKNLKSKWNLPRSVYSGLGENVWNWDRINEDFNDFLRWLNNSQTELKATGSFGNHRKYVSLSATYSAGTGSAIGSYLEWVNEYGTHSDLITGLQGKYGTSPNDLFDGVYRETSRLTSFHRMGKFDLLCMIGKMNLMNIEPGSLFMSGATGPNAGARILFGLNLTPSEFDRRLTRLGEILNTPFAMQVMEDAICNWQKNTTVYRLFRG